MIEMFIPVNRNYPKVLITPLHLVRMKDMDLVCSEERDDITILTLVGSETNPINLDTVSELQSALDNLIEAQTKGLVITSKSERFFSIGFDLPRLLDVGREGVAGFYENFNELCLRLYTIPIPTITAITGHCVAGGCILAGMSDFRFMAEGRGRVGVNELKLGLPVPYLASGVLTQIMGDRYATNMIFSGQLYENSWIEKAGFVDQIVPQEQVLEEAVLFIQEIASYPKKAFKMVKAERTDPIKRAFFENKDNDRGRFLECWFSDATQELLNEAKKKF